MNILWIVAARSGSKSLPNKNIRELGGQPLLSYRIKSALECKIESEVWLSTDSEEYAKIGIRYGAKVPFIRPEELSTDNANSVDVVLHAMNHAQQKNLKFELVGLLEPTSPFITSTQLEQAVNDLIEDKTADSIVAVRRQRPATIYIQKKNKYLNDLAARISRQNLQNRQANDIEITPSGGFYISKWKNFLINKTFYTLNTMPYEVDDICGLEIDETIDWLFAEFIITNNLNKR